MELKQLQALVAISEHGSFSAAAKALDTVQSNISAHLSRLEKELGSSLIDRASGELTDEGEMVLARAKRILHEVEDIDTDIHSLGDSVSGDCRIGTLGTTARWLMPPLLNSLTRHHPGVRHVRSPRYVHAFHRCHGPPGCWLRSRREPRWLPSCVSIYDALTLGFAGYSSVGIVNNSILLHLLSFKDI